MSKSKGPAPICVSASREFQPSSAAAIATFPTAKFSAAPVKDSVEGHVTFNAPSIYQGIAFDGIRFEFKSGKIVDATSNETKKLNKILDSDPGARYIGEFSLGFNPRVFQPMRDILFDEKIAGSFHFTPGQAYEEADNGNRSQVHWDMVSIQRPDYGGGEIYFDGKLLRKNGEVSAEPTALAKLEVIVRCVPMGHVTDLWEISARRCRCPSRLASAR